MKKENNTKSHSLPRTQGGYEQLLVSMIEKRRDDFDVFLWPQVILAAQCWLTLNKVHSQIMKSSDLTDIEIGSQGQQKTVVNPLVPYYLKLAAELRLQFQALGLNFNATPSKIVESTRKGADENDLLANLYRAAKDGQTEDE